MSSPYHQPVGVGSPHADVQTRLDSNAEVDRYDGNKQADGPGDRWICDRCGFVLVRAILRASDGAVAPATDEIRECCHNDGTPLRRVTWKEEAADANRVGLEQMKRADQLQEQLAAAEWAIQRLHQLPQTQEAMRLETRALRAESRLAAVREKLDELLTRYHEPASVLGIVRQARAQCDGLEAAQ